MAKFAIMQMFDLVAIFATNAILKLKGQYPGSVVPLAMFKTKGTFDASPLGARALLLPKS